MATAPAPLHIVIKLYEQPTTRWFAAAFRHGSVFHIGDLPTLRPDAIADIYYRDGRHCSREDLERAAAEAMMDEKERDNQRRSEGGRPNGIVMLTPRPKWNGRARHAVELAIQVLERMNGA